MHSLPDDVCALIRQNDPFSDDWREGSFVEQLTEYGRFHADEYLRLEGALIEVAALGLDVDTLGLVVRVFEQISLMVKCHVDPHDVYRIEGLDEEQVVEFDRRIRFLMVDISFGNAPDMGKWELAGR